tara:strand:- start:51 stop:2324 length:2274 start_codon:yes stop_codon:yes gene_type:complete
MGMNSINDLEYFNSLDNSDTDDNFEQFEPVLSRAEEALIKAKKSELTRSDRRANFHMNRERPEENKFTVQGVASTVADFTPVVGEIKAASELPNDLSYAFELVESGYDEGDLKKMGLGGAFAVLSTMGIVPGVRIGAKAGKEAIKGSIKAPEGLALTKEEKDALSSVTFEPEFPTINPKKEIPPQFLNQLKKLEKETKKSKPDIFGLTPEAVNNLVDDLAMLGKSQNQIVTNKQLKELVELQSGFTPNVQTTNELESLLNNKGVSTINSFDEFEKLTGQKVKELDTQLFNEQVSKQKFSEVVDSEPKLVGGTFAKADVDLTPDQKFLVDKIRRKKAQLRGFIDENNKMLGNIPFTENQIDLIDRINTIGFKDKKFDMRNKADQIEIAKLLPKPIRRTIIQELNRPVPKIFHGSQGISQPYRPEITYYSDKTRADVLEDEGFLPYTDFEEGVEIGLGGGKGATGVHMELGKKMLSTSRDPLVSIKRGFGANIPANVVSAPFPRSMTRPMTPEEYDVISSKAQYSRDDTPVSLPTLRHQEAEIAFSRPEDIKNIRQLSKQIDAIPRTEAVGREDLKNLGKMSLEDRVITGQKFANNIVNKFDVLDALIPFEDFSLTVPKTLTKNQAQVAYNEVRDIMKDLQALGQFTEQYGARGTYDSLYKTFRANNTDRVKHIAKNLPEGEKKNMLNSLQRTMQAFRFATGQGAKATRNKSDKELLDILKKGTDFDEAFERTYTDEDLKRMSFLITDRLNRGGLMAKA